MTTPLQDLLAALEDRAADIPNESQDVISVAYRAYKAAQSKDEDKDETD